jgi:hypothetical protein
VGAGPTASSLLERLAASAPELLGGRRLRVHLVDPHRAGTGRVWRPDLHPLLWMNSMAEDVTMFTDASVRCEGPIRPGPSLHEWAREVDDETLAALATPDLAEEIRHIGPMTFPSRLVQSVYLDWFHRRVLDSLPPGVEVVAHERRAVDLGDGALGPDGRQRLTVADAEGDEEQLEVDVVVLALGHLDAEPTAEGAAAAAFAAEHGLAYLPPGHTAEQDLSVLRPGAEVIALGFGQAFTDLMILLTEGRGGRFVEADGTAGGGEGDLRYEPSGREPVVHVGSRRGVPYRSKLDYRLQAPLAPLPRFLDGPTVAALLARPEPLEFRRDLLPLVVKEVGWAYYHELFAAHPERTTTTWDDFAARYAAAERPDELDRLICLAVPDEADRLDLLALDRPLAGQRFTSAEELQRHLHQHVAADIARRTDPAHSADLGAFMALLVSFGVLGRIGASGRLAPRSVVEDLRGWWFSFFMYYASGPPPARLRQLLALADAGLLRFIGADAVVRLDEEAGCFVASSASAPGEVRAEALVDARVATPSVSRSHEILLRRLQDRGEVVEEVVVDGGWSANTGRVVVTGPDLRLGRADGSGHPRRHGLGAFTNRPAAGAFSRPRTNAPAFRQNDLVARSILTTIAALAPPASQAAVDGDDVRLGASAAR